MTIERDRKDTNFSVKGKMEELCNFVGRNLKTLILAAEKTLNSSF